MFAKMRDIAKALSDARTIKGLIDDRSDLDMATKTQKFLEVWGHWTGKTATDLDDQTVAIGKQVVPHLNPFWSAWEQKNAGQFFDATINILAVVAPLTETEIDDRAVDLTKSTPTIRVVGVAVLDRLFGGERMSDGMGRVISLFSLFGDDGDVTSDSMVSVREAIAEEMIAVNDPDGCFGAAGEFGTVGEFGARSQEPGSVTAVISAVSLLLNLVRFIANRRD